MIRDHKQSDIAEIVSIYTLEYLAMPAEIEDLKSASKILVYDDKGVKAFIRLEISGTYCYVEMGAAKDELIEPMGLKLWEEAKKIFVEGSINFVTVFHVKENTHWKNLFDKIGFEYWYSVYRFQYSGDGFNEPEIQAVKYEDRYYEDKIRLESEAFSVLRQQNDIKPYNWYLSAGKDAIENARKTTLNEKENIYLFFDNNDMVGASMVKNAEIDLLFVNIKHQGKGYGQKILEFTVNRGLEQNSETVHLNALAGNTQALKLYNNLGFKVIQAQDVRRQILNR